MTLKLTIEPTADFDSVGDVIVRIWTGHDESGTEVKLWIAMVQPQTHDPERLAAFEAALHELVALT